MTDSTEHNATKSSVQDTEPRQNNSSLTASPPIEENAKEESNSTTPDPQNNTQSKVDSDASFVIRTGHAQESKPIPLGEILSFESANFKGQVLVRVKEDKRFASYFVNKRRLSSVVVTGRFKSRAALGDLLTGQEFKEPLKSSPGWFLVNAVLQAFKFLAPLLQAVIAPQSHFLSPVAQTAQRIHVAETSFDFGDGTKEVPENSGHLMHKPTNTDALQPDVINQTNNALKSNVIKQTSDALKADVIKQSSNTLKPDVIKEPSDVLKPDVVNQPAAGLCSKQGTKVGPVANRQDEVSKGIEKHTSIESEEGEVVKLVTDYKKRRKFFSKPNNLKSRHFDTDKFYTFEFYDDKFHLETYTVNILGQAFDVSKYLDGQPMRIMARHKTPTDTGYHHDNYIWNFEIWHRKLTDKMK